VAVIGATLIGSVFTKQQVPHDNMVAHIPPSQAFFELCPQGAAAILWQQSFLGILATAITLAGITERSSKQTNITKEIALIGSLNDYHRKYYYNLIFIPPFTTKPSNGA
jgi:hypothetical protein